MCRCGTPFPSVGFLHFLSSFLSGFLIFFVCVCVSSFFRNTIAGFCWRNRPKEESMSVAVRTQRRDGVGVSFSLFLGVFSAVSRPPLRTCQLAAVVPFFFFALFFNTFLFVYFSTRRKCSHGDAPETPEKIIKK